jgi:hypothetical protein
VSGWEYAERRLLALSNDGPHRSVVHLGGPESLGARQERLLAEMDGAGWELVTIYAETSHARHYVFRRAVAVEHKEVSRA